MRFWQGILAFAAVLSALPWQRFASSVDSDLDDLR